MTDTTMLLPRSSSRSRTVLLDPAREGGASGVEHRCSESEVLQYMLEVESSRQNLEHYARELSRLAEHSAEAAREAHLAIQKKDDLLAMMSHEIRTPLNGILGMASLLTSGGLNAVEQDYVDVIKHSGEALLALVDGLLDFSKMQADRLELEQLEFSVAKTVDDAIKIIRVAAERKGLTVIAQISEHVPALLEGDPLRLRQILLNLLSNAVKFTSEGSVTLQVEFLQDRAQSSLRFTVVDQGIGISEEAQARLFQPFTQADASISRQFGGTGLGLAICKRLAEMMGGSIGVTSQMGEGSSFWFTVRAQASRMQPSNLRIAEATQESLAAASGARILLVEDNLINQKVATLMLKKLGYGVTVAANGLKAMEALADNDFDLIFMDCLMPGMDGFATTRAIRKSGVNGERVPIVAMTANAFAQDREACFVAGMNDYVAKPIREADLKLALDKWLPGQTPLAGAAIA